MRRSHRSRAPPASRGPGPWLLRPIPPPLPLLPPRSKPPYPRLRGRRRGRPPRQGPACRRSTLPCRPLRPIRPIRPPLPRSRRRRSDSHLRWRGFRPTRSSLGFPRCPRRRQKSRDRRHRPRRRSRPSSCPRQSHRPPIRDRHSRPRNTRPPRPGREPTRVRSTVTCSIGSSSKLDAPGSLPAQCASSRGSGHPPWGLTGGCSGQLDGHRPIGRNREYHAGLGSRANPRDRRASCRLDRRPGGAGPGCGHHRRDQLRFKVSNSTFPTCRSEGHDPILVSAAVFVVGVTVRDSAERVVRLGERGTDARSRRCRIASTRP
jgi:hypothetical protein